MINWRRRWLKPLFWFLQIFPLPLRWKQTLLHWLWARFLCRIHTPFPIIARCRVLLCSVPLLMSESFMQLRLRFGNGGITCLATLSPFWLIIEAWKNLCRRQFKHQDNKSTYRNYWVMTMLSNTNQALRISSPTLCPDSRHLKLLSYIHYQCLILFFWTSSEPLFSRKPNIGTY